MSNSTKLNNLQLIVLSVVAVRLVNNGEDTRGKGERWKEGRRSGFDKYFLFFLFEFVLNTNDFIAIREY